MEILSFETIKDGLTVGALVAVVSAVAVVAVGAMAQDSDGGLLGFAGRWAGISVVFGVVAAMAYVLLQGSFGLDGSGYLCLALGMAVTLTVLEFLPLYGGSAFAPHWQVYAALNFIYGVGFGYLVPRLVG